MISDINKFTASTLTQKHYEQLLGQISESRHAETLKLDRFLRAQTSWLTSPASTRFHLAREGGLLEHSVNVAETLLKMRSILAPEVSIDSCLICAIFPLLSGCCFHKLAQPVGL